MILWQLVNHKNHFRCSFNFNLNLEVSGFWKSFLTQILLVLSNGMLVNKQLTSKLSINRHCSELKFHKIKVKESWTRNSFCAISEKIGAKLKYLPACT